MSEPEKCPVVIDRGNGWSGSPCDKPVKRDGMCGVHAAAKERRVRNDAARAAKHRAGTRFAMRSTAPTTEPNQGVDMTKREIARLEPTPDNTPPHGLSWRDGLDYLDRLLDDCAQHGIDHKAFVRVSAVRDIVAAVRRYEDDTDESIRQALWEDAVINDEPWSRENS